MSKQWETLAGESLADALQWKQRARTAEDNARRLLSALEALLDEADMDAVCDDTQAVVDQARAAIAAARSRTHE